MNVQRTYDTQLWYLDCKIQQIDYVGRNAFLFMSAKIDGEKKKNYNSDHQSVSHAQILTQALESFYAVEWCCANIFRMPFARHQQYNTRATSLLSNS